MRHSTADEEETEALLSTPGVGSSTIGEAHATATSGTSSRPTTSPSAPRLDTLVIPISSDASNSTRQDTAPSSGSPSAKESKHSHAPPAAFAVAAGDASSPQASSSAASSAQLERTPSSNKELGICRICLEEDLASNLESPCGCAGTQRYAHHACIQRWVEEKGHLRCEVCEQQYKGQYVVPPPPPPPPDALPLFAPMYIHVGADDGPHGRSLEYIDDSDNYYQRNPGISWCFTFVIFVMFLVVLHHTMIAANGVAYDDGTGTGSGMGGGSESDVDEYATSLTLFLLWVGTKAFLIGIPLYTVMKIAARQARREQYEAMIRAGAYDATARRMVLRVRALRTAAARNAAAAGGGSGAAGAFGANAV